MEEGALPHKRTRIENTSDFINLSDFSTNPSQQSQYSPITREEWSLHCESRKRTASVSVAEVETTPSIEKTKKSVIDLLDDLMSLVQPIKGKERVMRSVSRELRSAIQDQHERLTKDCPTVEVTENVRTWCTGIFGH